LLWIEFPPESISGSAPSILLAKEPPKKDWFSFIGDKSLVEFKFVVF
jgi:hypothetical protein